MKILHYIYSKISTWFRVERLGWIFLIIAFSFGIIGYLNQNMGWNLGEFLNIFLRDFYANICVDLGSIAITILIIDRLYQKREMEREKLDLIIQMGSTDIGFALEAVRKLRVRGWLEDGSLKGAILIEANLMNANLAGADLCDADLSGADLKNAFLRGALLKNTRFFKAEMDGADLTLANLTGAYLQGAKLQGAIFSDAIVNDANFDHAYLLGASISDEQLKLVKSCENVLKNPTDLIGFA